MYEELDEPILTEADFTLPEEVTAEYLAELSGKVKALTTIPEHVRDRFLSGIATLEAGKLDGPNGGELQTIRNNLALYYRQVIVEGDYGYGMHSHMVNIKQAGLQAEGIAEREESGQSLLTPAEIFVLNTAASRALNP
jgi:hypothetical protein